MVLQFAEKQGPLNMLKTQEDSRITDVNRR